MRVSRRTVSAVVGLVVVIVAAILGIDRAGGHDGQSVSTGSTPGTGSTSVAGSSASSSSPAADGWIDASKLPSQARDVLDEIDHGGPFEYPGKDGSVFGNYEGRLPHEPSGYYHEYTVDTPGASTRGTRRIITGRNGELYWTPDHYNTFLRIRR